MRIVCFIFNLLLSVAVHAASAQATTSIQSQTRETDYTIGDVAVQHLTVEVPKGYVLDEGSIPEKAQTDAVELRDIHWTIEETASVTRYQFDIDWQIFVAFETVKSTPLRGLELVFKNAEKSLTVSVPADSVLISNLLPPKMDEKHVRPYPNVAPQKIDTFALWLGVFVALFVLLASSVYIAWFMGWIRLPSERNMPFRLAWRQIKSISASQDNAVQAALKVLGAAVSAYAGYVVTHENVSRLSIKNSHLHPYAHALTKLYQDIQHTFFAGKTPTLSLDEVKKLAKQLSSLELS